MTWYEQASMLLMPSQTRVPKLLVYYQVYTQLSHIFSVLKQPYNQMLQNVKILKKELNFYYLCILKQNLPTLCIIYLILIMEKDEEVVAVAVEEVLDIIMAVVAVAAVVVAEVVITILKRVQ